MKSGLDKRKIINRCIYCGATGDKLTNEHIVPYAFWGNKKLYKACCKECQDKVSGLELDVLKRTLLPVRTKFRSPTRREGSRPTQLPITYHKDGKEIHTNLPIHKHPTLCFLPEFPLPTFLDKREYISGIQVRACPIYTVGHPTPVEFAQELGADTIEWEITFNSFKGELSFARMLAKIAYTSAINQYGPEIIDNSYVRSAIVGKSNDTGRWVGCLPDLSSGKTEEIHHIDGGVKDNLLLVRIKLFSRMYDNVPQYIVVVGPSPNKP